MGGLPNCDTSRGPFFISPKESCQGLGLSPARRKAVDTLLRIYA
jgi:hypothetical protein